MEIRGSAVLVGVPLAWLLACGDAQQPKGGEEGTEVPIPGMYKVEGATIDKASGEEREISGTVILAIEGDRYTATFHLRTTFPGSAEAPVEADVIGRGEGTAAGRTLTGTSHLQLVVATVPGIDPNFAFIPRQVSTRVVSDSVTTISKSGSVAIDSESRGEPGESYSPTKTRLRGKRVAAAPIGAAAKARAAEKP